MLDPRRTKVYVNPVLPLAEVQALWLSDTGEEPGSEHLQRLLDQSSVVLALYIDDRLVGILRALSDFTSTCYVVEAVTAAGYSVRELLVVLLQALRGFLESTTELVLAPRVQTGLSYRTPLFPASKAAGGAHGHKLGYQA